MQNSHLLDAGDGLPGYAGQPVPDLEPLPMEKPSTRVFEEALDVPATDSVPLAASLYRPAESNGRFVQINPATAVQRGIYANLARYLAGRGFTALTYDYRGTGESLRVDIRRFEGRMRHWGERDLAGVIDWVEDRFARMRHLCIAHSVGGQILGLTRRSERLEAVYGVCAQWGTWRLWPAPRRWYYRAFSGFAPLLTAAAGYFPGRRLGMGDLPAQIGNDWMRWCGSEHYIVDDDGQPLRPAYDRLRARARWVGFTDDIALGPPAAVARLAELYEAAESTVEIIDPRDHGLSSVGHFGFFRSYCRDALWPACAEWLESESVS